MPVKIFEINTLASALPLHPAKDAGTLTLQMIIPPSNVFWVRDGETKMLFELGYLTTAIAILALRQQ
jgi:hypothetical protein